MIKVIVFGGSGFLGSHVADQLSIKGYKVVVFDNRKSDYLKDDQEMIIGEVTDRELVRNAIQDCSIVYHFAAIADIKESQDNPVETVKINVLGTIFILEACREFKIKQFIYGSTVYVYSAHGSFYRSSKQSCELFIENYKKIYGLNYTILRYGSLYGPRANHFNFINNAINQALVENRIDRKGDGNELREYIHVIDAARASVEILNERYFNSNLIISGIKSMRIRDLLNMINEILNNEIKIKYNAEKMEEHYEITPYSFKPRIAKKYMLNEYHDLGEGILDLIYKNYNILTKSGQLSEKKKI